MDADAGALGGAFNDDARDAGLGQTFFQILAQLQILLQEIAVLIPGVPAGIPGSVDPQPEADGIDLLTH